MTQFQVIRKGWGKPRVIGEFTTRAEAEAEAQARDERAMKDFREGRIMYDVPEFEVVPAGESGPRPNRRGNGTDEEFRKRIADEVQTLLGDAAQTKRALVRYESIWYSGDARTTTPRKVAEELVREWRRSPGPQIKNRRRNGAEKSCGFAIGIYNEDMIEADANELYSDDRLSDGNERFMTKGGSGINDAGWAQLNDDIPILERNCLDWLRKKFNKVRDDGHDSYGDLVGSIWYDPENTEQMELLELASPSPGRSERIDMHDAGFGDLSYSCWRGVSSFGNAVLSGAIVFFDCDEEF
jgi:hypothetical protein